MKPYERYVPSGVEWIGDIPEGWRMSKIGYFYDIQLGKMLTPNPSSDMDELSDYLCSVNVDFAGVKTEVVKQMWISPNETQKYRLAKGDLIVAEGGDAGVCCFWNNELSTCYIQNAVHRVRSIKREKVTFLYYWLYTLKKTGYIDLICNKATIAHLTREKFSDCPIVLPDPDTQTSIVDYLERETAQIDNIIKAKEMLIDRLKEKRTAVITHAVTKGLDPKAKMKPSGVDWIGDIPEGWRVKKLKYVVKTKITDGPHTTPELVPDGIPFVSAEAVKNHRINLDLIRGYISETDHKEFCLKCKPQKYDIFMIKSGATTGNIAIVDFDAEFSIWSPLALIRAKENEYEQRYVFYSMLSNFFVKQVSVSWSFGTQQNIGMGVIENLAIFAPPKYGQKSIISYLDTETAKIDTTIEKTKLYIEKLKEYRTALISACVTGKIDVRSVV